MKRAGLLLLVSAGAVLAAPVLAQTAEPEVDMAKRGRILALQCRSCHNFKAGEPHKIGPNLNGIIGAAAAGRTGFAGYSDALKGAGLVWDEATLGRYLAGPSKLVPGTKMLFAGIAKPEDRAAVIGWLTENTK